MTGTPSVHIAAQTIQVRDLVLSGHLGVTDAEQAKAQRVRIAIELAVTPSFPDENDPSSVVDYGNLVPHVRELMATRRPRLLETLAQEIAAYCFTDGRALRCRVGIEKLDLYPEAGAVGVDVTYTPGTS